MCGIGGIIAPWGERVDRLDLKIIGDSLAHRGPDGEGIWIAPTKNIGLVHRRLAILDVSERGAQPMHSADGAYSIVFNGEIFNFIELRQELCALGSTFIGESDTEVLLEAWRHWREEMLSHLNGMWAFVICDNKTGDLFFARDRFGVKPLLYAEVDGIFVFASEVRALLSLPWIPRDIDVKTAKRLLIEPFSIEGGERTLVKSIKRIPAGHYATLHNGKFFLKRWWFTVAHLPDIPAKPSERNNRFRKIFFNAIGIRLRSDVPIGTCLSGGFDSSAIICAISEIAQNQKYEERISKSWQNAFVGSFPGQPNDETDLALRAAKYAGIEPFVKIISDGDALPNIDQVLHDLDDIYISLPTAPWQIYRELRHANITVSIDGHGADELMGGYRDANRFYSFFMRNALISLGQKSPSMRYLIDSIKAITLSFRGLNFVRGHRFNTPPGYGTPFDHDKLPKNWGSLNRRLYRMFHATVLPTILRNFDRISMAHGIEVRMPFMDWRLVTYVMALPDEAKSDSKYSKLVAREAMIGRMPEDIRSGTRKVGFNSPMPGWMNGPLRPWIWRVLETENKSFESIVNLPELKNKVKKLTDKRAWDWENVGRLWPYIHLKWYMENVLNNPVASKVENVE